MLLMLGGLLMMLPMPRRREIEPIYVASTLRNAYVAELNVPSDMQQLLQSLH